MAQGLLHGLTQGTTQGLITGFTQGLMTGFTQGLMTGFTQGFTQGSTKGFTQGLLYTGTQPDPLQKLSDSSLMPGKRPMLQKLLLKPYFMIDMLWGAKKEKE